MTTRAEKDAAFAAFHAENPRVYELFDYFTKLAISRGHKRMSADMILHRIRFETAVETTDPDFKINNNHRSRYARLWMQNNPQHDGFFQRRKIR